MASFYGLYFLCLSAALGLVAHCLGAAAPKTDAYRDNIITRELFFELEELARIVDVAYCVGSAGLGIQKPFQCASHCGDEDFKNFELVTVGFT